MVIVEEDNVIMSLVYMKSEHIQVLGSLAT